MTSLRLSAAVASRVGEWMVRPSFLLKAAIHNLMRIEAARMAMVRTEKSTGSGLRIFSTELLTSSTPMTRIMAATISPAIYSMRAWP